MQSQVRGILSNIRFGVNRIRGWAYCMQSEKIVTMRTSRNRLQFVGRLLMITGGIGLAMAAGPANQEPIRLSRETCTSLQTFSIPASGALIQTAAFITASE